MIDVIVTEIGQLPKKAHIGDAGYDLHAAENCTLLQFLPVKIRTGVKMAIPMGWHGEVFARSSTFDKGVMVNTGIIDSGYRGEILVQLTNFTPNEFRIEKGDRIAQLIIAPHATHDFRQVDELPESDRGTGGFGSTGK